MIIKQLLVFVENRVGCLNEIISILGESGVNLRAFSVADGAEFGILKLIVSDIELATSVLKEANFKVSSTDVVCINCPNIPGSLSSILDCLAKEDVFIEYMYAFSEGEIASIIIRPTDVDKCVAILEKNQDSLLAKSPLYRF